MMKMRTLLLLSAIALLVHLALASPHSDTSNTTTIHLKDILDLAKECKTSLSKPCEIFVEDVSPLTEGNNSCANAFFCKVQSILVEHENLCNMKNNSMRRHVKQYNRLRNVKCAETPQGLNSTASVKVCATMFLDNIKTCVRRKIFFGGFRV